MDCVNCGANLEGKPRGNSSIYGATSEHVLCEPCFFEEEAMQEAEGTNNLPHVLEKYNERLSHVDY